MCHRKKEIDRPEHESDNYQYREIWLRYSGPRKLEAFSQVSGFWLNDKGKEEFVVAKEPGGKPPTPHGVRAYLLNRWISL